MKNVFRALLRDYKRLFTTPTAVTVILFLIVLPSMYTWLNVIGFWDPYGHTGNLTVCIVNEDEGAYNDTMGQLDIGDQVVEELKKNDQLAWEFTDYDSALEQVRAGHAYAAIVIPKDFSSRFTTLISDKQIRPEFIYYVNEKAGAVTPKITDTGASTLEEQVNSTFISVASEVVTQILDDSVIGIESDIDTSRQSAIEEIDKANNVISTSQDTLSNLSEGVSQAETAIPKVKESLATADSDLAELQTLVGEVNSLTGVVQQDLNDLYLMLLPILDQGSIDAIKAATITQQHINDLSANLTEINGQLEGAIAAGTAASDEIDQTLADLKAMRDAMPQDDPAREQLDLLINTLEKKNDNLKGTLEDAQKSLDATQSANEFLNTAINEALNNSFDQAQMYRDTLINTTIPSLNNGLSQVIMATNNVSQSIDTQRMLLNQTSLVVELFGDTISSSNSAILETNTLLSGVSDNLSTVRADIAALSSSEILDDFMENGAIDPHKVSEFMKSPTCLKTETLYPLNAYGSAMAPLFMNLSFWIGAFMLMVILRLEVDDEGFEELTVSQRYWVKFLFLVPISVLQAVVCCAGNIFIGVQTANIPLFYVTAIITVLAYLAMQFTLSVTLQHVGKAICIILVFAQIPAATGLYPIETAPKFFRVVYPMLPFTYGINALRETIAGFYGYQWVYYVAILLVFLVVFVALGLLLRPMLTNLNRMFAHQIADSDILMGEVAQVPKRRFGLVQIVQVFSNRDGYRDVVEERFERFEQRYPKLVRGIWIFGIIVPTILTFTFGHFGMSKVVTLTSWLVWLTLIGLGLVILDYIRYSLEGQLKFDGMSNADLCELIAERSHMPCGSVEDEFDDEEDSADPVYIEINYDKNDESKNQKSNKLKNMHSLLPQIDKKSDRADSTASDSSEIIALPFRKKASKRANEGSACVNKKAQGTDSANKKVQENTALASQATVGVPLKSSYAFVEEAYPKAKEGKKSFFSRFKFRRKRTSEIRPNHDVLESLDAYSDKKPLAYVDGIYQCSTEPISGTLVQSSDLKPVDVLAQKSSKISDAGIPEIHVDDKPIDRLGSSVGNPALSDTFTASADKDSYKKSLPNLPKDNNSTSAFTHEALDNLPTTADTPVAHVANPLKEKDYNAHMDTTNNASSLSPVEDSVVENLSHTDKLNESAVKNSSSRREPLASFNAKQDDSCSQKRVDTPLETQQTAKNSKDTSYANKKPVSHERSTGRGGFFKKSNKKNITQDYIDIPLSGFTASKTDTNDKKGDA